MRFKVWDKIEHRWADKPEVVVVACQVQHGVYSCGVPAEPERYVFRRSTELLDKNDKEIFEADTVHLTREHNSERGEFTDYVEDLMATVKFVNGALVYSVSEFHNIPAFGGKRVELV